METQHVFLDTEVFVRSNFAFQSPSDLAKLGEASKEGRIALHLTSITVSEVRNKISQSVSKAKRGLQSFRSQGRILRNIQSKPAQTFFDTWDFDSMETELLKSLDSYIDEYSVNVISVDSIGVEVVFQRYFEGDPPFSGKKKHEFPDAVTLLAVEDWAKWIQESIYVVSGDGDFKETASTSERLIPLESTADVLELLLSVEEPEVPELALQAMNADWSEISTAISKEFERLGFLLIDQRGDVLSAQVTSISRLSASTVNVEDELVTLEVEVEVEFESEVEFDDMSTAVFDREDGRYIVLNREYELLLRTAVVTPEVVIALDRAHPRRSHVVSVTLDTSRTIEVEVEEVEYPYW